MMLFLLAAAASSPSETPKAFMERAFAQYRDHEFNPFDHPDRYFAPNLRAAIREDERLAHGEVGYLDGDPICQCQDPDGMHAKVARVTQRGALNAIADVILDWTDSTARRVKFSLTRTSAGWRIADVSSSDEPSLLKALQASNAKARKRH